MHIPKKEYDIYAKLSKGNLTKLDMSICRNTKIYIFIPLYLNESIDLLNSSSEYYNDLCYTTTSKYGTGITLKDRKNEFIEGNKTVCQDDCVFSDYDYNIQRVKCNCEVQESSSSFDLIKINITKLYDNFKNIKNFANLNFLNCYQKLFTKQGLFYNIGSYILICIIIFHRVCISVFFLKQFPLLQKKISDIIFEIKNLELIKNKKCNEIENEENIKDNENDNDSDKREAIDFSKKIKKLKKKEKEKKINNNSKRNIC